MALLIAEPTMSGASDLERAVGVFGIPAAVCINKYNLNEEIDRKIKDTAVSEARNWRGNKLAYAVNPNICKGCGVCAKACPTGAIAGHG